jgi:tRNA nucleotidyltransferase/poly(A) polymerase
MSITAIFLSLVLLIWKNMRLNIRPDLLALINKIRSLVLPKQDIYLVGGALRDVILGRDLHDLDFATADDPTPLAKKIARTLKAGFFILDDDRHTCRVLYHDPDGNEFPLDFVAFTGDNLHEDLKNRDFTINAMALSLQDLENLIDPLNGRADLDRKLLRTCSKHALNDDPVRVLRGIRLANQFKLVYAEDIYPLMREAALKLPETSAERQRDEFFRILEGPDPYDGLIDFQRFDVFNGLIPELLAQESVPASPPHELPLFEHTLTAVEVFDEILGYMLGIKESANPQWWVQMLIEELAPFKKDIENYFKESITPGRSKKGLAMLGAILHDIGKPSTMSVDDEGFLHYYGHDLVGEEMAWNIAKRLQLSNAESSWVQIFVRYHMNLLAWVSSKEPVSPRGIYRFFRKVDDVGVALAVFFLADTKATYCQHLTQDQWLKAIKTSKRALSAWWQEKARVVNPDPLLNGHEIQERFGLQPGKKIGSLLNAMIESQVSGEVSTKEDAISFIHALLKEQDGKVDDDESMA